MLGDCLGFHNGNQQRVLNQDQEAFGNVQMGRKRYGPKAYCTSHTCAGVMKDDKWIIVAVIKDVSQSAEYCPNCKNALYWK